MKAKNILDTLIKQGKVSMETETSELTIVHRVFFGTKKEFLFILNAKAIADCKMPKTAEKKIQKFIDNGFVLSEGVFE